MEKEIPDEVLQSLIAIGSDPDCASTDPLILEKLRAFDAVNRLHFKSWYAVADDLDQKSHLALARGLVIAEEELRWSGGSVAGAIWVYGSFQRKFPQFSEPLAEWMLQRSHNPWVPFGSDRGRAKSLLEYRSLQEARARRRSSTQDRTKNPN
jgi:hypothetical protein